MKNKNVVVSKQETIKKEYKTKDYTHKKEVFNPYANNMWY